MRTTLTERDLKRIVKRVLIEQSKPKESLTLKVLRVYDPENGGTNNNNSKANDAEVKTNTETILFKKCKKVSSPNNCFTPPSTIDNGVYPPSNFSGDVVLYHNYKKYRCKLNKPCSPF